MHFTDQLILQSGEVFYGFAPRKDQPITLGEVVFNTGMTGYVETLTDPSYTGQIIVFTYPLIGNYGVPDSSKWESTKIQARGVVFSELSPFYSSHEANLSLKEWLDKENIPYITGVDTRALTKALRSKGVVPGAITPIGEKPDHFESFDDIHWVEQVSPKETSWHGEGDKKVIVIDCGMKENIMRSLSKYPLKLKRVPYNYDFTNEDYDGVFISNGPGDPVICEATIRILRKCFESDKPVFGICLGTQLMALAANATTFKLRFGHRSQNQPCFYYPTQKCYLTSQNHGFAILEESLGPDWEVTFRNLNDSSVAGIAHKTKPFFSVQFHPEACPGPNDTHWLFDKFYELIMGKNAKSRGI